MMRLHEPAAASLAGMLRATILICYGLLWLGQEASAQERKVATSQELQVALSEMKGGLILLAPGHYGDLRIQDARYGAEIILRSEIPRRAVFEEVILGGSKNLTFDGVKTNKQVRAEKSENIRFLNGLAGDILYFRNARGIVVSNSIVSDGQYSIILNSVSKFEVTQNRLGKVSEDVMRITGDSYDGRVENNIIEDVISYPPTHPDLIQMFGVKGKTPNNITIRRNFLNDIHATGASNRTAQGIFVSDPQLDGYQNILIEENIIMTRSPNTIYINGGKKNVVVRNNTLLPSAGDGGAVIRLAGKAKTKNAGTTVENNVAKQILDETKSSSVRNNYLYGRKAKITALFSGTGQRWQDFLPVLGTGPDKPGLGATDFLRELLAAQKPGAVGGPRLGPDWTE